MAEVSLYTQEYSDWLETHFQTLQDWSLLAFLKVASQFDDLELEDTQQFMGHEKLSMELANEARESAIGKLVYERLLPLFKARRSLDGSEAEDAKDRLFGLRDAMTMTLKERGLLMLLPKAEGVLN